MKRRTLALSIAALPAITACSALPGSAPTPTAVSAGVISPKLEGNYWFLASNLADPFYNDMRKALKDASANLGFNWQMGGPQDTSTTEFTKITEQVIADPQTKGIFFCPPEAKLVGPLVRSAVSKGIGLVTGFVDVPEADRVRNMFIGYDNVLFGQQAAAWIVSLLGGKGKVGFIGVTVSEDVGIRMKAAAEALKKQPGITVVQSVGHEGNVKSGSAVLDAYLVANPDLDLVWWADGLSGAMAGYWKEKQTAGVKTKFLACDMLQSNYQAIKDGVYVGTVGQDIYTMTYWAFICLTELGRGRRVIDTALLPAVNVDKSNVAKYAAG